MKIVVNGDSREVDDGKTIADLLAQLGLESETTVVEQNGEIVPRDHYPASPLAEGDTLELIRFVGGG